MIDLHTQQLITWNLLLGKALQLEYMPDIFYRAYFFHILILYTFLHKY